MVPGKGVSQATAGTARMVPGKDETTCRRRSAAGGAVESFWAKPSAGPARSAMSSQGLSGLHSIRICTPHPDR